MAIREALVRSLRKLRKLHRFLGLSISIFLLVSALTGILLTWKKDVNIIQPPTQKSTVDKSTPWLAIPQISSIALKALVSSFHEQNGNSVDRIDIRPGKGVAKVIFENGNWEAQIDGRSGAVLSIAKRHSDWIESLHDGSIISDGFKLFSMNYLGFGVILLIFTGIWLWWGPKKVRFSRRRRKKKSPI